MTKREFDAETKRSGVYAVRREDYRASRMLDMSGADFIAQRAQVTCVTGRSTLELGTMYRTLAFERRQRGQPLLFAA